MATCITLSRNGYGSIKEIKSLDTKDFLDLVEYENIKNDIESLLIAEARDN